MRKLQLLLLIFLFSVAVSAQEVSRIPVTDSLKDTQPQIEKRVENNLADALEAHAMGVYSQRVMFGTNAPSGTSPTGKIYARQSNGHIYGSKNDGTWVDNFSSTSPGGSTTQVQYNNSGSFGGSSGMLVNSTSVLATVFNSCQDAGATDSYACSLSPALAAYVTGQTVWFKAATANTGAATLNLNSLGAKTIKKNKDSDLADNDIKAGQWVHVVYDGTNFELLSPVSNAAGGITNSAGANIVPKSNGTNLVASRISDIDSTGVTVDLTTAEADSGFQVVGGSASFVVEKNGTIEADGHIIFQSDVIKSFKMPGSAFGIDIDAANGDWGLGDVNGNTNATLLSGNDATKTIKAQTTGTFSAGDPDNATVYIQVDVTNQLIKLIGLPASDPHVVGALWNSTGTLKISAGP